MIAIVHLLLLLAATAYSGSIDIHNGCNGEEKKKIQDAIADVKEVVTVAAAAIVSRKINGKEDVFHSAYDPLFIPNETPAVAARFAGMVTFFSGLTPLRVTVYCTEEHVRLSHERTHFIDEGFVDSTSNFPVEIAVKKTGSGRKPGEKGSYAVVGYKIIDGLDASDQAHIYLHESRRHPPKQAEKDLDLRRYPEIVRDGLDNKGHRKIHQIKPLAQTLLHEMFHVVGGVNLLIQEDIRRFLIDDGPEANTYGWLACNERRTKSFANAHIADCLTFLAQAIYLQIQGKDTYWTVGEVDEDTLRPPSKMLSS